MPITPLTVNEFMLKDYGCFYSPTGILTYEPGFQSRSRSSKDQYEALCPYISAYVKALLEIECHLSEEWLPGAPFGSGVNVFLSQDWSGNSQKALVIIPGSGKVTLGQWARGLCKDAGLKFGTMKPYIDRAQSEGFSVLVMNCNARNSQCQTNEENALLTWDTFVRKSPARDIYIVAHSYGGICTVRIAKERFQEAEPRVKRIAFTDSVHSQEYPFLEGLSPDVRDLISSRAVNWVHSLEPLDTLVSQVGAASDFCECRSAGHYEHSRTSESALESVFSYFSAAAISDVGQ